MKNAGKTVKLAELDAQNHVYIYRYTPSLFHLLPKQYKKSFPTVNPKNLLLRYIRGYWIYYIADGNELYAYDFIKKNYLNTYRFMKGNDVISNPNYTAPSKRGKGYAKKLFCAVIEDRSTAWTKLWGIIRDDNLPSIAAAEHVGFQFAGYSKRRNGAHHLTQEKTKLVVYCRTR